MRQRVTRLFSLLAVGLMLTAYCTTAWGALLDVGPIAPQVIGSTMPNIGNGFPVWYRDTARLPLAPCLSNAVLPTGPACVLLADIGFNPLNPLVFPTNYPSEAFYYVADARYKPGGVITRINYRAALEAAFATGLVVPGDQITFARIRIFADLPVAGTYKFTHPYGVETLVAPTAGTRAIAFTRDVGIGIPGFVGPVAGDLGPWLIQTGFPQTINGETFLGDPNVDNTVTGSPFGTNFLKIEGPVGANLDGLGNNIVQINIFTVAGMVATTGLGTPLTVDSATYTRDATNTQVEVFATTQAISNATTGLPPNPLALANIPSALQFSNVALGGPIPTTLMTTNNPIDGKFFGSASFLNPATMPTSIRVTNTTDVPASFKDVPLVDEVVISEASYNPATSTLKVTAASGDTLAPPTLSVVMLDGQLEIPLGTIAGGSGTATVTFPLISGTKTYNIPPESVTVKSALGGSETDLVSNPLAQQAPVALADTATVVAGGSVSINVAANDSTLNAGATMNLASVLTPTLPTKGTITNNLNGTITYTQLPAALPGTDTFTYTIADSTGAVSLPATVTVTITAPLAPNAIADTATVVAGGSVTINVAANDSTLNAGAIMNLASVATPTLPTKGTLINNLNGTITYTQLPVALPGTDSFTYTIADSTGTVSLPATVTVTITAPAVAPVAGNDTVSTNEDTTASFNVIINDTATAPNIINPASLVITQPLHGTATAQANGTVSYTPSLNYNGLDSFTYTVRDSLGTASLPATVSITVNPVPDAPLTVSDTATTPMNTLVAINVLANDVHPDGLPSAINPATLTIATNPAITAGTVAVVAGQVEFTPALNFSGTASFTYIVSDNALTPLVSAPATVTVTVTPVNIAPVANNDVASTFVNTSRIINVVANDTDADGTINPASVVIASQPLLGTAAVNLDGTISYISATPGTATFTYNVKDNAGAVSNNATVTVGVTSPTTDTVSILRAQYTTIGSQWLVEGSTSPVSPAKTVTIYLGSSLGGTQIGTATTNPADGKWKFQSTASGVIANAANNTISVSLPSGASRLAFPVAIK